jgi:hypothetical protein
MGTVGPYEYDVHIGDVVHFDATALSPTGASILQWDWTLTLTAKSGTPEQYEQVDEITDTQELDARVPEGFDRVRINLTVHDEALHIGSGPVITLYACMAAGAECTTPPGGCCAGCDTDTNLCL